MLNSFRPGGLSEFISSNKLWVNLFVPKKLNLPKMKTIYLPSVFLFFAILLTAPGRIQAQQWQQVSELPPLEMTELFATGDTLYVAGTNKIYFTFDAGAQWDSTSVIHPNVDFIQALCFVKGRLFAGTLLNGVFHSNNGGQTWQADNTGLSGAGANVIYDFAVRGDSLYAGTGGAGVFVKKISTNSTWSSYNVNMPWFNIFSLKNIDGKLYAGAGGNATYALQSQPGNGWTEKSFAGFNGSLNALLGIIKQDEVLLAAGMLGLYRSADGGENWTHFNPGTGLLGSSRLIIDGGRVIANLAKPAALSFIKTTTDGGLSWQNFEPEITGSFGYDAGK
jgi:hypothetical protein